MSELETIECIACSAEFTVRFEDDDFTLQYCPSCGNTILGELELIEDIDPEFLYDEFDD